MIYSLTRVLLVHFSFRNRGCEGKGRTVGTGLILRLSGWSEGWGLLDGDRSLPGSRERRDFVYHYPFLYPVGTNLVSTPDLTFPDGDPTGHNGHPRKTVYRSPQLPLPSRLQASETFLRVKPETTLFLYLFDSMSSSCRTTELVGVVTDLYPDRDLTPTDQWS